MKSRDRRPDEETNGRLSVGYGHRTMVFHTTCCSTRYATTTPIQIAHDQRGRHQPTINPDDRDVYCHRQARNMFPNVRPGQGKSSLQVAQGGHADQPPNQIH